jgi:hypothetical protein
VVKARLHSAHAASRLAALPLAFAPLSLAASLGFACEVLVARIFPIFGLLVALPAGRIVRLGATAVSTKGC